MKGNFQTQSNTNIDCWNPTVENTLTKAIFSKQINAIALESCDVNVSPALLNAQMWPRKRRQHVLPTGHQRFNAPTCPDRVAAAKG